MPAPASLLKTGWIVLTSLAAGALAGFLLRPADSVGSSWRGQRLTATNSAPGRGAGGKPRAMRPEARARLDAFRQSGIPSRQIAAALALADLDSVEDIRDLLDHSNEFPDSSAEEVAIGTLLKRWLELDPQAALEYSRLRQPEFLARLTGEWSRSHPDEAAAFALTLPSDGARSHLWMEVCKMTALTDLAKAWEQLSRTPGLNLASGTWQIDSTVSRMVAQNVDQALASLEAMPPGLLASTRRAIAAELMKSDPQRGWDWARQQPNAQETMSAALGTAMAGDPAQALGFIKSLPAGEMEKVIGQSDYGWQLGNIKSFADFLIQDTALDVGSKQRVADRLFDRAMWSDPVEAQRLLPLLSADKLAGSISNYIRSLSRRDPAAAKAWAESLPEGPVRTAALTARSAFDTPENAPDRSSPESLASDVRQGQFMSISDPRFAKLTPEQLEQVVSAVPENQDYRWHEIVAGMAAGNPQTGAAWLVKVPITDKTGPAAAQFSALWAERDPAAAAAWVKTLPPGDLAETAALNVARQYQRYAPAEAAAWLNTLPLGPAQDAARKVMAKP